MRMHKNILGGGHLLGTSSRIARRHRCAGVGRPQISASAPRVVAAGASFALVLLVGALLFPTTPDAVHAEETTKAALTINPVLSLGLDSAVTMSVQPTSTGEFTSGSAELTVSTNNETGYSPYLSTANGKATLDSINPATTTAVQPVSGTVAADGFGANTWGYNLDKDAATDSTTYQAVPITATAPQATTAGPTLGDGTLAADIYNLNFGALINSDLPSGTYTNTVTVSVVTNPAYLPPFEGIETMQEMTSSICSNADEGETARLKDTRDGKLYWVTKLKDENCWMTQNLDFDIPADGLTNENGLAAKTDLPDGTTWATGTATSENPYPATATEPEGTITSNNSFTGTFSWDFGYYVKSDPDGYSNYCSGVKTLSNANCTSKGWINVGEGSGYTALTEEQTDSTSSSNPTYEVTVVDEQAKTYDAHYLVGNMYQYTAATAGTGGNITSTSVTPTGSVCPKGWTLPSHGTSSTTGNDFYGLTTAYSIHSNSAGATAITQAPLYFSPAGRVNIDSLTLAGLEGFYWSSTASSNVNACNLHFRSGDVSPSGGDNRHRGQSVRCLAR